MTRDNIYRRRKNPSKRAKKTLKAKMQRDAKWKMNGIKGKITFLQSLMMQINIEQLQYLFYLIIHIFFYIYEY